MFIVSLAAVINGLGIVRLLSAFSEYLRFRNRVEIRHYPVFSLFAGLQLLLHVFFWWSLWSLRDVESFNFVKYLYLLSGPTLLYLATSLLAPSLDQGKVDLETSYYDVRRTFFTVMSLAWVWGLMLRPLVSGELSPTWPFFALFLASSLLLRWTENRSAHLAGAVFQCLLLLVFIAMFGMRLGHVPGSPI